MKHIRLCVEIQADIQIQGKVSSFFDTFSIGKLLHRCGVRKRHGYGPRFLIEAIFILPFIGMNLYRVLTLAVKQLQELNTFGEKTMQMFFATLIEEPLSSVGIQIVN